MLYCPVCGDWLVPGEFCPECCPPAPEEDGYQQICLYCPSPTTNTCGVCDPCLNTAGVTEEPRYVLIFPIYPIVLSA